MHTPLLWCDIETTGLDPHTGLMLELGLVLTDTDLNIVDERTWVLGWTNIRELIGSDFVREMHERSGLLDEAERSKLCVREVEQQAMAWIKDHDACGLYMAGSGVHFDRRWLRVQMPALVQLWHYRNMDMTTLRYFFGTEKKEPGHRSLDDLHDNIESLLDLAARASRSGLVALPLLEDRMAVAG